MTERLAKWVGRQALEYTYAEIAKQVGIDEKTVRNVFDGYVPDQFLVFMTRSLITNPSIAMNALLPIRIYNSRPADRLRNYFQDFISQSSTGSY